MTHHIAVAKGQGRGAKAVEGVLALLQQLDVPLHIDWIETRVLSQSIQEKTEAILQRAQALFIAPAHAFRPEVHRYLNHIAHSILSLSHRILPFRSLSPFPSVAHFAIDLVLMHPLQNPSWLPTEYRQTKNIHHCIETVDLAHEEQLIREAFCLALERKKTTLAFVVQADGESYLDKWRQEKWAEVGQFYPLIQWHQLTANQAIASLFSPSPPHVLLVPYQLETAFSALLMQLTTPCYLLGSACIGEKGALFGQPPVDARSLLKQEDNPAGSLISAILLLNYLGETKAAASLHNAHLKTLQDGIHTIDLFQEEVSSQCVCMQEWFDAVAERISTTPSDSLAVSYEAVPREFTTSSLSFDRERCDGVDLSIRALQPRDEFIEQMIRIDHFALALYAIYQQGVAIWPARGQSPFSSGEYYQCRFLYKKDKTAQRLSFDLILSLLSVMQNRGFSVVKYECLYSYDGKKSYCPA